MKKRNKIILCITIITVLLALAACGKKKSKNNTNEITPTPTLTPTPTEVVTPTPTITPTEEIEEPVETDYISEADAIKNIKKVIGERGYTFELLDDHLTIDDNQYYIFQISSTTVMEPNVLVDKVSGELFCYYEDGTVGDISEHPLLAKTTNEQDEESKEFTKEDALAKLSELPLETLNLPSPLSEYTIVYDDWPTIVEGVECYGINVFKEVIDNDRVYMGSYYVATDGSVMFIHDSLNDDFKEIK